MRVLFMVLFFFIGCGGGNRIVEPPKPPPYAPVIGDNGFINIGGVQFDHITSADLSSTPFILGKYQTIWYGTTTNGGATIKLVNNSWGDLPMVRISRSLAEFSYHFDIAKDINNNLRLIRATGIVVGEQSSYSFLSGKTVEPLMYWPANITTDTVWTGYLLDHIKYDFKVLSINAATPESIAKGRTGLTEIIANPDMGTYVSIWYFSDGFGYFQQTSIDGLIGEVASTPITP